MKERRLSLVTLVLVAGLFLALLLLAAGNSPWLASAAPVPTVPTVPTVPPPPGGGGGGGGGPSVSLVGLGGTDIVRCPSDITKLQFADWSVSCPPPGFSLRLMDPALGSYPDGKTAWGFRGPGDVNLGVFIYDTSTPPNPVKPPVSFAVTVCLRYPATAQLPPYGANIQFWNGGAWVTLTTTAPVPAKLVNGGDGLEVCTTIPAGGP